MSKRIEISALEEVLLRQVYPKWLEEEGQPSSMAFYPWRQVDEGSLSVDRGSMTTPEESFRLFTTKKPLGFEMDSVGVWGLEVGEVVAHGIVAFEDPVGAGATTPANPAHALLDFERLEPKTWKKVGRILKMKAWDRGRLFPKLE